MKKMYYDNIFISELMIGDHLEHHGVLGMKWGVRRYQPYSTVPRKSGKSGTEIGAARKKSDKKNKAQPEGYFIDTIRSGKDFEITPGSRMYRSTDVDEVTARDRMYVSLYRGDADRYANFGDIGFMGYVDEYTPTKPLKIAGIDEANKIVADILGIKVNDNIERRGFYDPSQYFKNYDNWSEKKQQVFHDLIDSLDNEDRGVDQTYMRILKSKGYDGVVDLVDLQWETLTPTVIFTDGKNVERKQHYNIDSEALDMALSEIWGYEKGFIDR